MARTLASTIQWPGLILDQASSVAQVCCWFPPLLQGFFSWFSSFCLFPTLHKNQDFQLMLQTVGKEAPAIDVQLQIFTFYLALYSHMLTGRYIPTNCARALLSLLNFLFELTLSSSISCCGSGSTNLQQQLVTINNIHCPSLKYNASYND